MCEFKDRTDPLQIKTSLLINFLGEIHVYMYIESCNQNMFNTYDYDKFHYLPSPPSLSLAADGGDDWLLSFCQCVCCCALVCLCVLALYRLCEKQDTKARLSHLLPLDQVRPLVRMAQLHEWTIGRCSALRAERTQPETVIHSTVKNNVLEFSERNQRTRKCVCIFLSCHSSIKGR